MPQKPPKDNLAAFRRLTAVAMVLKNLPAKMAEYYANGGAGVGQGVVGDRFSAKGNGRFAPLSYRYAIHKAKMSNKLNKAIKLKHGKGSKKIDVKYQSNTGTVTGFGSVSSLPILVLSGDTRAAVTARSAVITQKGDTAYATFRGLPDYTKFLQSGTAKMPKRSPVDPNEDDMARVIEFAERQIKDAAGLGAKSTSFGEGVPRIFV